MRIVQFCSENCYNLFKSFLTCVTFFIYGCSTGILGASLLDLQILVNIDFAQVSLLLTTRAVGHVFGTIVASFLDAKFDSTLILSLSNLICGIFLAIAPYLVQFEIMAACFFIIGTSVGVSEVLCNTVIVTTWKEKCTNFLQVLYMFLGIGALVTPVITRSYLLPNDEGYSVNGADSSIRKSIYTSDDVIVHYAYLIIGTISIVNSIPFMLIYLTRERKIPIQLEIADRLSMDSNRRAEISKSKVYLGVALVAAVYHFVCCLEAIIGSLGTTFTVKSDLHLNKKVGVLLATVFWSCFSFTRLIYIPLTFCIAEFKLQLVALIISLAGILITVPWALHNETCIWIGFTLIGIGISPIFASAYGMLNKKVIVTSKMTSIIVVVGILGESFHPAVAATLMTKNMATFLYYIAGSGISYIVLFLCLDFYCRKNLNPSEKSNQQLASSGYSNHVSTGRD